jgi:hypothetical protein
MKKTILFITLLLICLLSAKVRAQKAKSLWIAASAGVNTSLIINQNAYGNGELDYSTTLNLTAGPGIRYFISRKWGINSSVNWARLGQNYRGLQSGGQATRKVKLDYVEFHILAMRRIENANQPTWIAFGPEIMLLTAARQEYHNEEGSVLPKPEYLVEGTTDIKDRIKPFDIALNFSLNRMFDFYKNQRFMCLITANMAYGLTDISKKEWNTPNMHGEYSGSHNFYMGIRVGVMYRASKGN